MNTIPMQPLATLTKPNGPASTTPNSVTKPPAVQIADITDNELHAS